MRDRELALNYFGYTLIGDTILMAESNKREHEATYASDKRDGGYLIRIVGPRAPDFAGMEVPVKTKSGEEHTEKLTTRKWFGADKDPVTGKETGKLAALYAFESRPREIPKPPVF